MVDRCVTKSPCSQRCCNAKRSGFIMKKPSIDQYVPRVLDELGFGTHPINCLKGGRLCRRQCKVSGEFCSDYFWDICPLKSKPWHVSPFHMRPNLSHSCMEVTVISVSIRHEMTNQRRSSDDIVTQPPARQPGHTGFGMLLATRTSSNHVHSHTCERANINGHSRSAGFCPEQLKDKTVFLCSQRGLGGTTCCAKYSIHQIARTHQCPQQNSC